MFSVLVWQVSTALPGAEADARSQDQGWHDERWDFPSFDRQEEEEPGVTQADSRWERSSGGNRLVAILDNMFHTDGVTDFREDNLFEVNNI